MSALIASDLSPTDRRRTKIHFPRSAVEAVMQAAIHDATYIAGASALQLGWDKRGDWPLHAVALQGLAELQGIGRSAGCWHLGALTRLAELVDARALYEDIPLLRQAALSVGAAGIRQLGTLAGNIGFAGDLLPALLVLQTQLDWLDAQGARHRWPLTQWLATPQRHGLIIEVRIPVPPAGSHTSLDKLASRSAFNPPLLSLASACYPQPNQPKRILAAIGGSTIAPCLLPLSQSLLQQAVPARVAALSGLLEQCIPQAHAQRDYLLTAGAGILNAHFERHLHE